MKVKYLVGMAGSGYVRNPGDVADLDADEAGRLIEKGFVEKTTAKEAKAATAKSTKVETAATR